MSEEGSEDSPPRPKRKIKKVMVLPSSSSSDSDDSVTIAGTRRKRLRVVSDEGASDSSGSSVVRAGTRRSRALPKLRDSDLDSDTSGWATDHSDEPGPPPATTKPTSGFASDSSEGNSDKCSICLLRFTTQEVGTPQSCEHIFCLDCITEWSKNVNTCPVDRMTFDYLVVRACVGGRVLRTEPVRVVERRPSVEMLVVEDPTVCEICGSTENEEEMLLCDGCDLGYHMQCLTPPLREVPMDQWLCPNCDDLLSVIHLSEVDNLFSDIVDMDMDLSLGPRASSLREVRNVRRSSRTHRAIDEPSTSSGHRGNANTDDIPTTSRGAGSSQTSNSRSTRRRPTTTHRTHRRKYRRRTKTVIIEYEVQENGKRPIKGTVRRVKKRKSRRRQPRTAARRSYVLESVRAKLASQRANSATGRAHSAARHHDSAPARDLALSRQRAGIPSLSLFGDPYQLDYFSDNENDVSEGASTAVAIRPTSSILSAYRQARRKMISIPSPPHATSTPDVLSSILESQALLHSKKSVVSISVDGNVNIKLESREQSRQPKKPAAEPSREDKVDISKGEDAARKAPYNQGQSRGNGGGWGGGYRGNYHRDQGANNFNNRGGNYDNSYGGGYQNRQGNSFHQNNNMRREDGEAFNNYARRPHQYSHNDDSQFERNRRQSTDNNRGPQGNFPHNQRLNDQNRFCSWQPHAGGGPGPRHDAPPPPQRHSFGGFDNPLDMRVGQTPPATALGNSGDVFPSTEPMRREKPPSQPFQPLPEPPIFKFDKTPDVEKSEDERSDSGLVIDTEKYDPMEPTNDDDSSEEDKGVSLTDPGPAPAGAPPQSAWEAPAWQASAPAPAPAPAPPRTPTPPPSHSAVQNILAGIDTSTINVPHNILDSAVRQVLMEHRNLITPTSIQSQNDKSDEDSDGDCPNFSIYSATSVHIANNTGMIEAEVPKELPQDNLEDLVQEDDESPETTPSSAIQIDSLEKFQSPGKVATPNKYSSFESNMKKKTDEEYKEKVSKRCPITTNTRNPIKIKLNTPTLIKRQITLYDEEDETKDVVEPSSKVEDQPETQEKIEHKKENLDDPSESPKNDENVSSDNENLKELNTSTNEPRKNSLSEENDKLSGDVDEGCATPDRDDDDMPPSEENDEALNSLDGKNVNLEEEPDTKKYEDNESDKASELGSNDDLSDVENEELCMNLRSPKRGTTDRSDENLEKMTESISETEDERSYTPCLDENKSKDTSLETDKEKGIEGLDTEMISEDEGNEMFSDSEKPAEPRLSPPALSAPLAPLAPLAPRARDDEEGEIPDKKKDAKTDETKKKKKKESKKDSKDKKVKPKKSEVAFKKLSKSGKERNYRERDKEEKSKSKKERRDSGESTERERLKQKRKEKRKDLERYDVRNVVTVKRKKLKDPFGRDISPRARSRSASAARSALRSHSPSPLRRHSPSPVRRRSSSSVRRRSPSPVRRRSPSPVRRRSPSPVRRRSPSLVRRRSPSPVRRRSPSPVRRRSLSPVRRRSITPARRRSPSPVRRRSPDPRRGSSSRARGGGSPPARASASPRAGTPRALSPAPRRRRRRSRSAEPRRRRSAERARKRRRSADPDRSPKPKPTKRKKRARSERAVSRRRTPRRKSPKRKKPRRRSASREPSPSPAPAPPAAAWSPASGASRLPSPRTPPPDASPERAAPDERRPRRRRDPHRRPRDPLGPSKEVFTSGDNILVSVSFQERERLEAGERRERRERRRSRRRRRRRAAEGAVGPAAAAPKPVAIIDLERSPFRELTPSPKNVIVLSDSEPGEKEPTGGGPGPAAAPAAGGGALGAAGAVGPKTPPEPGGEAGGAGGGAAGAAPAGEERGPNTPPEPPSSPDAYDPFEPTRSASPSPSPAAPSASPPRTMMTLETAQKTNMSADEVLDRRPLSPIEKVMALLQSTRDVSPEPPPGDAGASAGPSLAPPAPPAALCAPPAPAPSAAPPPAAAPAPAAPPVRIVLPSPTRAAPPKLFLAKPSPIKSDPIKPMQAAALPRAAAAPRRRPSGSDAEADSPYSPGSSDFGDLFEPPAGAAGPTAGLGKRDVFDVLFDRPFRRKTRSAAAKVPVKLNRKKGKTQVGVKVDEDNLKVLDDLPSSAVEMQVKSKFLKKLNRQERVVEEVKLVLKPHYNKKHVSKDEYKHILRRTVPKICHNKTGEINPTKIQALVEAYVKKFRKKHKLGLV